MSFTQLLCISEGVGAAHAGGRGHEQHAGQSPAGLPGGGGAVRARVTALQQEGPAPDQQGEEGRRQTKQEKNQGG